MEGAVTIVKAVVLVRNGCNATNTHQCVYGACMHIGCSKYCLARDVTALWVTRKDRARLPNVGLFSVQLDQAGRQTAVTNPDTLLETTSHLQTRSAREIADPARELRVRTFPKIPGDVTCPYWPGHTG
eukprot:957515-Prorocentrum_minimum.AAC.1